MDLSMAQIQFQISIIWLPDAYLETFSLLFTHSKWIKSLEWIIPCNICICISKIPSLNPPSSYVDMIKWYLFLHTKWWLHHTDIIHSKYIHIQNKKYKMIYILCIFFLTCGVAMVALRVISFSYHLFHDEEWNLIIRMVVIDLKHHRSGQHVFNILSFCLVKSCKKSWILSWNGPSKSVGHLRSSNVWNPYKT